MTQVLSCSRVYMHVVKVAKQLARQVKNRNMYFIRQYIGFSHSGVWLLYIPFFTQCMQTVIYTQ